MKYHFQKMLTKLEISSEELARLNYERYHYPCPLVQKRLHSIYIKAISGLSNEDVGNLTDAHRNSISEWMKMNYGTNKSLMESHAANIVPKSERVKRYIKVVSSPY